jgi:hypothetical protein
MDWSMDWPMDWSMDWPMDVNGLVNRLASSDPTQNVTEIDLRGRLSASTTTWLRFEPGRLVWVANSRAGVPEQTLFAAGIELA